MGTMFRQRAELVDDIWHACGDTATDYNWYAKLRKQPITAM
jgi:ubiquinone biosynthesis protein COQ9